LTETDDLLLVNNLKLMDSAEMNATHFLKLEEGHAADMHFFEKLKQVL